MPRTRIARDRAEELREQPRLTDAGFAADEHDASAALREAAARFVQRGEFVAAPDENRARHRADDHDPASA